MLPQLDDDVQAGLTAGRAAHHLVIDGKGQLFPQIIHGYLTNVRLPDQRAIEILGSVPALVPKSEWACTTPPYSLMRMLTPSQRGEHAFNLPGSLVAAMMGMSYEGQATVLYGPLMITACPGPDGIIRKLPVAAKDTIGDAVTTVAHVLAEKPLAGLADEMRLKLRKLAAGMIYQVQGPPSGLILPPGVQLPERAGVAGLHTL